MIGEDSRIAVASRRIADARSRSAMLKDDHTKRRNELMEAILNVVTKCADHRSNDDCHICIHGTVC